MIEISDLPHYIAGFNAASVVCLAVGFAFIRNGEKARHRAAMLAALGFSAAFLVVYVIYKANSGFAKFGGEGWIRPVYFTILIVHVVGAIAITPLVPITVYRALKSQFDRHRRLARWTWPMWMFVGISGVIVYLMAVHLFPVAHG
jgi:putative membrane protein